MTSQTVADLVTAALHSVGVRRIYGVVGDSLNGITESIRKRGDIDWIHTRHEETAAFAAGAEAHLTGQLAVCAGSCGPGNLHLINGLFDCQRSRVPVLAIAAHIPSPEIGRNYFQGTHPNRLFSRMQPLLRAGVQPRAASGRSGNGDARGDRISGRGRGGHSGDVALREVSGALGAAGAIALRPPIVVPGEQDLAELAALLNASRRTTLFCGRGCAGAHDALMSLAEALKSPIVHALGGKEFVEYDNPYDVGMTGLIGFASGYDAMMNADTVLMLGTDFPYRQFYPGDAKIAQIDIHPENIGRRLPDRSGAGGRCRRHHQGLVAEIEAEDRPRLSRRLSCRL